jgi:hypothetical protein
MDIIIFYNDLIAKFRNIGNDNFHFIN